MGVLGKSSTLRTSTVPHFGLSICGTVGLKKGSTVPHFYYRGQKFHTSTTYTEDDNHTKLESKRGVAHEPRCVSPPPLLFAATHRKAPPSETLYNNSPLGGVRLRTGATPPLFLQYPLVQERSEKGGCFSNRPCSEAMNLYNVPRPLFAHRVLRRISTLLVNGFSRHPSMRIVIPTDNTP